MTSATPRPDVLFVSMPFYPGFSACYQIEYLAQIVRRSGLRARCAHLHYDFARDMADQGALGLLDRLGSDRHLGDYLVLARRYPREAGPILNELLSHDPGAAEAMGRDSLLAFYRSLNAVRDSLLERIAREGPRLVAFSATHYQLVPSLVAAHWVKEAFPALPVALGGYMSSPQACEDLLRGHAALDVVVFGEGEDLVAGLAEEAGSGAMRRRTLRGGRARTLDAWPDYSDFLESGPLDEDYREYLCLSYELSRGCYWDKCDFCNFNAAYGRFRSFDVAGGLDRIREDEARYGIRRYVVLDTSMPPKAARAMAARACGDGARDVFCEIMVDFDRDMLRGIRAFGVKRAQIGIESFSSAHLASMAKNADLFDNLRCLRDCLAADVDPVYGVLVMRPGDRPEHYSEQVSVMKRIRHLPPPRYVSECDIRPGSPIFAERTRWDLGFEFRPGIFDRVLPASDHNCELRPSRALCPALETPDLLSALDDLREEVDLWRRAWRERGPAAASGALPDGIGTLLHDPLPLTAIDGDPRLQGRAFGDAVASGLVFVQDGRAMSVSPS